MSDTIFALASPPGRSAIAVIRLSGADSAEILRALAGPLPEPRRAALRRLRDPTTNETLDRAVVLWFPAPASYTGEDSVEFQLHGGVAVVGAVSRHLLELGGRPAVPGEFTRRAFENQRLDLLEAEGVADLIEAQTDAQRRQALRQLGGGVTETVSVWRDDLLDILSLLEAAVDFPEDELPADVVAGVAGPLDRMRAAIAHAAHDHRGEQVRAGYRVALTGAPNVGKSSLFNALLGRDAAIVNALAGTTRDVVEAQLTLGGHAVILADTAGIGDHPQDEVEREGMRRARAWADGADLRLHVATSAESVRRRPTETDWVVLSKADLEPRAQRDGLAIVISVVTGEGVDELRTLLGRSAAGSSAGEPVVATRARHRELFARATEHLDRASAVLTEGRSPELVTEDVRLAARALEGLSGRIDTEEVLGRVFSSFCIGK